MTWANCATSMAGAMASDVASMQPTMTGRPCALAARASSMAGVKPPVAGIVTSREREVLEWIYRGKSNIEIGMILRISPLTVKNHVQKILRKLDVLNRTQAVGKALALRILNT